MVYTISGGDQIYVGETRNATQRLVQHLDSTGKRSLKGARVIVDETFNKSACLDLEAFLIQLFAGDGQYQVLNISTGTQDADYYRRAEYRQTFREIFDELRSRGAFTRPIHEIENTDLYKLSPFKSLTHDQAIAAPAEVDAWPMTHHPVTLPVVLVARTHAVGLAAACTALSAWGAGALPPSVALVGLVMIADGPKPSGQGDEIKALASMAPKL